MPTTLGRAFPGDWAGYPPHMSAPDFRIWTRFRKAYPALATQYYFDVGLGLGAPLDEPPPPPINTMWQRITSLRADAVADTGEDWILIELRDNASTGALGAVLTYAALWKKEPPDARPMRSWLVTNRIHPDLPAIFASYDVHLVVA